MPIDDLGGLIPGIKEKAGLAVTPMNGIQRWVSIPVGPPVLVDSGNYKHAAFVAPCDGCYIKEAWLTGAVKIASGTNTFAVDNYDASANAARNVLSTTNIDPDTITAKEGLKLTLTSTAADLAMDEGDVLNVNLICGTQTTAGEGYLFQACIIVPEIA